MKKLIALLFALVFCLSLVACGNENWGIGNYTYTHVHFAVGPQEVCANVKSWHDNELGCEVHTEEFGSIYLSEGTYVLMEDGDLCPHCGD